jgi:hypothetical protein
MKLCKDCRWIRPRDDDPRPLCGHPTSVSPVEISRVTGKEIPSYHYTCADMRYFLAWDDYCGQEGVHWEPVDATPAGFT